jgi:hypothetical protein
MLELEGKLVRLENGAWARYRAIPTQSGVHMMVAIELSPQERERVERESDRRRIH